VAALIGTDRFEIRRCLGSGSFGVVYEALDRERKSLVAMKFPHQGGAQGLYLFKQEFRSLADVTHPNLITLFELFTEGDRWFFTMELVDGVHFLDYLRRSGGAGSLDSTGGQPTGRWIHTGSASSDWPSASDGVEVASPRKPDGQTAVDLPAPPADYNRVRSVLKQLAEGLLALHSGGMLHRDLKPSNVLVTRAGRVVILDFGLVADLENGGSSDSFAGPAGTPAYMAPEQIDGQLATPASDWYSVGILLYQALTGRLPFAGSSRAMLLQKLQEEPLEPHFLVPGTPPDLEELCMGLLRKEARSRIRGQEILERLKEIPDAHPIEELENGSRIPSMVVRTAELDVLVEGFRLARGGRTVAALLHGESGTGKSSLARGFLKEVLRYDDRAIVLQGRCYEQESVPFKAVDSLMDALSQYLKRLPPKEADAVLPRNIQALARLFPVLNQVPWIAENRWETEIPDAQELRRRAFGALREVLRRMTLRHAVVLFIDDLQWGDLDSAALLSEILRAPDPPQVMLLLAYRGEDAQTSPILLELLPRLVDSVTILQDVELHALSPKESEDLALLLLGGGSAETQASAAWIAEESGGSPFFIQELAKYVRRMAPAGQAPGERRLDDYIRMRVEALPADSRAILQTLALAGYPLEWEVIQQAAGVETGSIAALTGLRAEHLIRMKASSRRRILETYHDRIRVAVAQSVEAARSRDLNLALAQALESRASSDAQALSRHFEAAGVKDKACAYAIAAASQAEATLAFDQAAVMYEKALGLRMSADPKNPPIWRKLGDALANAGRSGQAAQAYLRAAEDPSPAEANRLRRRAAEEYLRNGDIDSGMLILDTVLATAGTRLSSSRLGALASILWNRLRLRLRGLKFTERPADQIPAEQLERVDTYWAAAMGLGPVDVLRAADFQTRQLLLTLGTGEPFRMVRALAHETILIAAAGNRALEKTHDLRTRTFELAERIGHPNPRARACMAAGIADIMQGRWRSGAEWLAKTETMLKQYCTGMDYELHLAQHNELIAHLVLGELGLIRERYPVLLQEAREKGDLIAATNLRTSISYILRLTQDDPGVARQELTAAIEAWSRKDFHLQHYHHLVSRVNVDLYTGAFHAAMKGVREAVKILDQSLLMKIQLVQVTIRELRARSLLALASRLSRPRPLERLLRAVRADIRRIRAERTAYGEALALKLEAMRTAILGRKEESLALFQRAELMFDACDMQLHVMAMRYVRGRLLGEAGVELVDTVDAWMRERGIQNPRRFCNMHVPLLR
jgi:eukaryotic-like serine/threonine-protein kinase